MTDEQTPLQKAEEVLKASYAVGISAEMARQESIWDAIYGPRRKGHYEESLKDPKFLSAREAWVERWKRITAEGEELGYLEHENCYECGGELVPTTNVVDRTFVYDEPLEEFEARRIAYEQKQGRGPVIFPVHKARDE